MIDNDPTEKDVPSCAAALAALQSFLDGAPLVPSQEVDRHLATCAECRGRFAAARRMQAVLGRSRFPEPTQLTTERLVETLIADRRRRQFFRWAGPFTLAASVLLAVWLLWAGWPFAGPSTKPAPELARPKPAALFRDELAGAGEAVLALAGRAARESVEPFAVPLPDWDPTLVAAGGVTEALDPAAAALADAKQGLADGFAPVADSAKRAMNLFHRDLPLKAN